MACNCPINLVVGQVTMTGSAVQVVGSNPNRKRILIRLASATGSAIATIGPDDTVTHSNGYTLRPVSSQVTEEFTVTGEIWAIGATVTTVVFAEESY